MKKARAILVSGLLAGASATAASASPPPVTNFTWSNICVASSLTTCASIQVSFNSFLNTVTMNIWNLGTGASLNQILTQIGLTNSVNIVPTSSTVSGMTGFAAGSSTSPWSLFNDQHPSGGGAITLDFLGATGASGGGNPSSSSNNGIVNSCSSLASGPTADKYWVSQCGGGTAVSFTFGVASTAGWDLAQSQVYFKAQNGPTNPAGGTSWECLTGSTGGTSCSSTVTPEPATLLLITTGLGLVVVPVLRRRRRV